MKIYKIAAPVPIGEGEGCFEKAMELLNEHPTWHLHKGPPEPKSLFWEDDTAHFWLVDDEGNVHDPTSHRYPGYDYSNGKIIKLTHK